jgi:drug/metabolite transporter (DMT)-like permease
MLGARARPGARHDREPGVLLLSPVFGALMSAAVIDERLGPPLAASAALIIAGAILSYWRRPSAAPAVPPPRV